MHKSTGNLLQETGAVHESLPQFPDVLCDLISAYSTANIYILSRAAKDHDSISLWEWSGLAPGLVKSFVVNTHYIYSGIHSFTNLSDSLATELVISQSLSIHLSLIFNPAGRVSLERIGPPSGLVPPPALVPGLNYRRRALFELHSVLRAVMGEYTYICGGIMNDVFDTLRPQCYRCLTRLCDNGYNQVPLFKHVAKENRRTRHPRSAWYTLNEPAPWEPIKSLTRGVSAARDTILTIYNRLYVVSILPNEQQPLHPIFQFYDPEAPSPRWVPIVARNIRLQPNLEDFFAVAY